MRYESKSSSLTRAANISIFAFSTIAAATTMAPHYCETTVTNVAIPIYSYIEQSGAFKLYDGMDATSTYDSAKESDTILDSYIKLGQIRRLGSNWNGYGAGAFDSGLINVVYKLIPKLIKQPEIFPTGRNTIQLEYDGVNNSYLEIEIKNEGLANFFFIDSNGNEKEYTDIPNGNNINKLVKELYG
ncbi:MAG: hypothetical protein J6H31_06625 [Butyrivibrio sp.]|nr:hypothetical protein [Butyrivibrio sp.]